MKVDMPLNTEIRPNFFLLYVFTTPSRAACEIMSIFKQNKDRLNEKLSFS